MRVPLLNFEGGPGVPTLNFKEVPGPTFKLWGDPVSQSPEVMGSWSHFYTIPIGEYKIYQKKFTK